MFNQILVPLDGSLMAESAVPAAAFLAEKLSARVTLMHVIEKNAPNAVHGQPHLNDVKAADAYLKTLSQKSFPEGVVVDCHVHEAAVEDVAKSIVSHADELNIDLVIMCSHGRGKALHLFLGSIAQSVITLDSLPVLITHPDERGEASAFSCQNIMVPLDNNPEHAQALPYSKELASACGAAIHLTTVIPRLTSLSGNMTVTGRMLPGTTSRLLELEFKDAEEYLQNLLKSLIDEEFTASAHVLRGDPAKTIVEVATRARIDLIFLATHGKAGMKAFWAGSVTNKICSLSKVPLLLIPIDK